MIKHLKLCDDFLEYSINYCHVLTDIVGPIVSYREKNNLGIEETLVYNSLKYQDVLSSFCISLPLESSPPETEILNDRKGVGTGGGLVKYCQQLSVSDIKDKIVFVVRAEDDPNRKITNSLECFDALKNTFKDYDTISVKFEDISFQSQIDSVKDARLLVGPHGAGMANCLFMQPESCLVEVFPSSFMNRVYHRISDKKNMKYDCFHGKSIRDPGMTLEEFFEKENRTTNYEDLKLFRHTMRDIDFSVDIDQLVEKCENILARH
jgi:hypothetical protein